jgi:hypothetical protein
LRFILPSLQEAQKLFPFLSILLDLDLNVKMWVTTRQYLIYASPFETYFASSSTPSSSQSLLSAPESPLFESALLDGEIEPIKYEVGRRWWGVDSRQNSTGCSCFNLRILLTLVFKAIVLWNCGEVGDMSNELSNLESPPRSTYIYAVRSEMKGNELASWGIDDERSEQCLQVMKTLR